MDSDEEAVIACTFATITVLVLRQHRRKSRKPRTAWTREVLLKRKEQGAYPNLVRELRDTSEFRKFFRMDQETFEALLAKVGPLITRVETNMRESISPGERLAVTLRFLATGML